MNDSYQLCTCGHLRREHNIHVPLFARTRMSQCGRLKCKCKEFKAQMAHTPKVCDVNPRFYRGDVLRFTGSPGNGSIIKIIEYSGKLSFGSHAYFGRVIDGSGPSQHAEFVFSEKYLERIEDGAVSNIFREYQESPKPLIKITIKDNGRELEAIRRVDPYSSDSMISIKAASYDQVSQVVKFVLTPESRDALIEALREFKKS